MMHTVLTDEWGLGYPIIGAPMAGAADGGLAAAISQAGGLGMFGVGSAASVEFVHEQAKRAGAAGQFGIGLMVWALQSRPELLDAAIAARPTLISLSFGDPAPYVSRCHAAHIRVATQVHTRAEALQAEQAGVDLIVAQGTEAGGHTGSISTLPLLQIVLAAVSTPVAAAGGIATPAGVAAVLAAGAVGAWIGTAFLASPETKHNAVARDRILQTPETDTVLTHVFDHAQRLDWPQPYPGRAICNAFTDRYHGQDADPAVAAKAQDALAAHRGDYEYDFIYAGQAIGLVHKEQAAGEIVRLLGDGAERCLRERMGQLLDPIE